MATEFEAEFVEARKQIEDICDRAGEASPAVKETIQLQLREAEDSFDRIQDILSEIEGDAAHDVGATPGAAPGTDDHTGAGTEGA